MTGYFRGPKPPGKAASLAANERVPASRPPARVPLPPVLGGPGGIKPPAAPAAKPPVKPPNRPPQTRTVTVKQHTRRIAVKTPPTLNTKPAPLDTRPAPVNTKPAPIKTPQYKGKHGLGAVGRVIEQGAANIVHSVTKPAKPYSFKENGVTVKVPKGPGVGAQAAGLAGLPTEAITHPLRYLHAQRHLAPQQKADSAIGLHVLGALAGFPAASRIEAAGARKGLTTVFSGGGSGKPDPEAWKAELASLQTKYDKFIDQFVMKRRKLSAEEKRAEQQTYDQRRRFKKQQTGKTKAGKASGASGRKVQHLIPTDKQAERIQVEQEMHRIAKDNPEHSGARAFLAASNRIDELRALIGKHEEEAFGPLPAEHGAGVTPFKRTAGEPVKPPSSPEPAPEPVASPKPVAPPAARPVAPVAASHMTDNAEQLRAVLSGRAAKQALKAMGKYEKIGAKGDPYFGKSVRQLQKEQKLLYSQERGKRFAAARVHLNNQALEPAERVRLAKHELKGELPKIHFQGFTELSDAAVTAMQKHILDHPLLHEGQKIRASEALTNALTGKLPTPSELKILEYVFGRDTTSTLGSIARHPYKDTLLSAINVPRSLMASFDLSAPFRQGLTVATRHPSIFARNFKPMIKAFGNEQVYHATLNEIRARPTYPLMMEAKLSLTELGGQVAGREEQFQSDLAERIPGVGRGVRASGRAYTGFLDKTRADVFDHLIQRAQAQGSNVHDDKFLKDLGRYVNSTTGRGPLGSSFQGAASALNAFFFSPRLLASRLDLIFSPVTYAKADPFVRREAIRSMVQLAGTASVLLGLAAQIKGAKVVTDPRNPDWGKIRFGNTRVDIGGGFQQPLRLFAQLGTGVAISSTTGKKLNLTAGGFGQPNRLDLFLRFFEGKESPVASLVTDWARNSDQIGNKFSWRNAASQRLVPLLAQDSYDLYKSRHGGMNGLAAAFAGYGVGSVGFGLQTYGARPTKARAAKPAAYFGSSSSSGGSSYFNPTTRTGGSSYFAP